VLLLQEPIDGVSLEELFSREPDFEIDEVPSIIVYSKSFSLTARVFSRALSSLSKSLVPAYDVNEFLFFVAPYVESLGLVYALLDNEDDMRRIDDVSRTLGVKVRKFTSANLNGDVKFAEPVVLDSTIKLLKALAKRFPGKRSETLMSSLSPEGLSEYVRAKREEIAGREVLVSPVFFPVAEVLGLKTVFDRAEGNDVAVVTSGADNIIARKKMFELIRSGKRAKEVLIDVDPILAPIYLLLIIK